ncbi:uncharacterized protein PSFLO_01577 [Pseudozyma flocculosa]|uniref:Uncharacterized protein n=1 Tax=Pseudozyma flocculosa TaxID=84751 RepID=A0A5C3EWY0_9BASI|nr:uncharacterized protein PSFLO_01577 [Pseudozyma flocculosa]
MAWRGVQGRAQGRVELGGWAAPNALHVPAARLRHVGGPSPDKQASRVQDRPGYWALPCFCFPPSLGIPRPRSGSSGRGPSPMEPALLPSSCMEHPVTATKGERGARASLPELKRPVTKPEAGDTRLLTWQRRRLQPGLNGSVWTQPAGAAVQSSSLPPGFSVGRSERDLKAERATGQGPLANLAGPRTENQQAVVVAGIRGVNAASSFCHSPCVQLRSTKALRSRGRRLPRWSLSDRQARGKAIAPVPEVAPRARPGAGWAVEQPARRRLSTAAIASIGLAKEPRLPLLHTRTRQEAGEFESALPDASRQSVGLARPSKQGWGGPDVGSARSSQALARKEKADAASWPG